MNRHLIIAIVLTLALPTVVDAQQPAHGQLADRMSQAQQQTAGAVWDALMRGDRDFAAGRIAYPRFFGSGRSSVIIRIRP